MVPKSHVDKTIESLKADLSARKQGIRYNSDISPGTINPISGRNMLLIATFNPDLGRQLNGLSADNIEDIIINITLPNQFFQKSVQKSDWLPQANDPNKPCFRHSNKDSEAKNQISFRIANTPFFC